MNLSRRNFIRFGSQFGLAAGTAMLWSNKANALSLATDFGGYKAVVLVSMSGGNDCNSFLVPGDASAYADLRAQRSSIALSAASYNQIYDVSTRALYGLHPSMRNVAKLYAQQRAAVVANIGSLPRQASKTQVSASINDFPGMSFSHTVGAQQWESGQASSEASSGWGGRLADRLTAQSGSLPPVLSAAGRSLFTVGTKVQAISIQTGGAFVALPDDLSAHILQTAKQNIASSNEYVRHAAELRALSMESQKTLNAAAATSVFKTAFPSTNFAAGMKNIAQIIDAHGVLGASRQIFYVSQGTYDTHVNQVALQASSLDELDGGIGAFFSALDEVGLGDQVLVCTHSDFGRSFRANNTGGTDHGWGGHQLLIGGGIRGGRVIGKLPQLVIGGPDDISGNGAWLPSLAITQMTAGIAEWMGFNLDDINAVFPDLVNFPSGAIHLS